MRKSFHRVSQKNPVNRTSSNSSTVDTAATDQSTSTTTAGGRGGGSGSGKSRRSSKSSSSQKKSKRLSGGSYHAKLLRRIKSGEGHQNSSSKHLKRMNSLHDMELLQSLDVLDEMEQAAVLMDASSAASHTKNNEEEVEEHHADDCHLSQQNPLQNHSLRITRERLTNKMTKRNSSGSLVGLLADNNKDTTSTTSTGLSCSCHYAQRIQRHSSFAQRNSTHFSTHSALLARRFLSQDSDSEGDDDDDDDDLYNTNTKTKTNTNTNKKKKNDNMEAFQDEWNQHNQMESSSSNHHSFANDSSSSSNHHHRLDKNNNSRSSLDYSHSQKHNQDDDDYNDNDLEWNPEAQRQHHQEYRKASIDQNQNQNQNQQQQQRHTPLSSLMSSKKHQTKGGKVFPSRPDLREVDQTVNLMNINASNQEEMEEYDESLRLDDDNNDNDHATTPSSRRARQPWKKHHPRKNKKKVSNNSHLTFMQQMHSSLEDIFLDNSTLSGGTRRPTSPNPNGGSGHHPRRGRRFRRKPAVNYYRENTLCQDLCCSKVTIVLIVAALLGAFVAWRTGAFWVNSHHQHDKNHANNTTFYPTNNVTNTSTSIMTTKESEEQVRMRDEFKALLIARNISKAETLMELTAQTDGAPPHMTPQTLALYWVIHKVPDPTVLVFQDSTNNQNTEIDADNVDLDELRIQAYVLAVLYYCTNGDLVYTINDDEDDPAETTIWQTHTHWMTPTPLCQWYAIDCEEGTGDPQATVVHLNLTHNNLKGTLPEELFRGFSHLRLLDLADNELSGTLPDLWTHTDTSIAVEADGIYSSLEFLWLQGNKLTGSLPASWGNLMSLQSIHLSHNQLTGSVPAKINQWTQLHTLALHHNQFTGEFPLIKGMQRLQYIWIQDNQFSKWLPYEFFRLKQLLEIRAHKNRFSGTIPPEIENLTDLRIVQLDENQISGHLNDIYDRLPNIAEIHFQKNKLTGSIPKTFGTLTNLYLLLLDTNEFSGTVPTELAGMTQLKEFRADGNHLSGTMPEGFCRLKEEHSLSFVAMDCNHVTDCTCCDECL